MAQGLRPGSMTGQNDNYVMREPLNTVQPTGQGVNQPYPQQMKPPMTDVYTYNAPQPATNPNIVVGGGRQTSPYGSGSSGSFGSPRAAGQGMANAMKAYGNAWGRALPSPSGAPPAFPRQPGQMPGMRRFAGRLGGNWQAMRDKVNQQLPGRMYGNQMYAAGAGRAMAGVPNAPVRQAIENRVGQAANQAGAWGGQVRGLLNRLR